VPRRRAGGAGAAAAAGGGAAGAGGGRAAHAPPAGGGHGAAAPQPALSYHVPRAPCAPFTLHRAAPRARLFSGARASTPRARAALSRGMSALEGADVWGEAGAADLAEVADLTVDQIVARTRIQNNNARAVQSECVGRGARARRFRPARARVFAGSRAGASRVLAHRAPHCAAR
jgi:hypothetical protein